MVLSNHRLELSRLFNRHIDPLDHRHSDWGTHHLGGVRINRNYISVVTEEVARYQDLAGKAASSGTNAVYVACNDMANEAFGKSFFMQIAMSAASLWPVFFAVDWMRYRFDDIEFQLLFTDNNVGFLCVFIAFTPLLD